MVIKIPPFRRSALTLAIALLCVNSAATAVTINVSGKCTLTNALNNANSNTDTDGPGGCPAGNGADTLNLTRNKVYTLKEFDNFNEGYNGLPSVSSAITINGHGATIRRADFTNPKYHDFFRILHITVAGSLTLNAVTVNNGAAREGNGGGILNEGSLTLVNSTVSGNWVSSSHSYHCGGGGLGGGIANSGTLALVNSTISSNTAFVCANFLFGEASGGSGGGILNNGDLTLKNSTVSGNVSHGTELYNNLIGGVGGGIINSGNLVLMHSTLAGNQAEYDGGGVANTGTMWLKNTLIANSKKGGDCFSKSGAVLRLRGINLIEDGSCKAPLSGAPKLGPLLDNGGITKTHALLKSSKAINAADNTFCPKSDQRNIKRPQPVGGICDIGAFEWFAPISSSVLDVVKFFDAQVASGGLVGVGVFSTHKREALRNQLLTAGYYKNHLRKGQSCSQLTRTLNRIDSDNTPDANDYISGSAGATLAEKITALHVQWSCPSAT